jgi:NADPH:quinone reductase-like Zn-dependent oxidoreductase
MPRSAFVPRSGSSRVFRLQDTPPRSPGTGEVRITVAFAGVNFADLVARAGFYGPAPKPPFVPGFEVSGMVAEVGARVPGISPGDRVLAVTRFGGYTTDLVADATRVRRLPARTSLEQGAAMPGVYLTAYHGLTEIAHARKGESVLIHACAGGVGTALVQLARHFGLVSYGTASSREKLAFAKTQGLNHGINYATDDFVHAIRHLTGGRGVDVVFDANGGSSYAKSYQCLAPGGRLVVFGAASLMPRTFRDFPRTVWRLLWQKRFNAMDLIDRNASVLGFQVLLLWDEIERLGREMDALIGLCEKGAIAPVVDQIFDLNSVSLAHDYLLARKSKGKVLLRMPGAPNPRPVQQSSG